METMLHYLFGYLGIMVGFCIVIAGKDNAAMAGGGGICAAGAILVVGERITQAIGDRRSVRPVKPLTHQSLRK